MTPTQFKAVRKDIIAHIEGKVNASAYPVCAFSLRSGQIYTGTWEMLTPACNTIVVTLTNIEAPPIYVSVEAIDAVAVDGAR